MFLFFYVHKYFLISLLIHWCFTSLFLKSPCRCEFSSFCYYWFLTLFYCGWKRYFLWYLFQNFCWNLTQALTSVLSWKMLCALEKNITHFVEQSVLVSVRSGGYIDVQYSFSLLTFCLIVLSVSECWISVSFPVELSVSPFDAVDFCFTYILMVCY